MYNASRLNLHFMKALCLVELQDKALCNATLFTEARDVKPKNSLLFEGGVVHSPSKAAGHSCVTVWSLWIMETVTPQFAV